jgi:hypothetical protein
MLAGVLFLALLVLLVWLVRPASSPAQLLAEKVARLDLVSQLQVALARTAEAEKSAVLATTDPDSQAFADQARAAAADVDRARGELDQLLASGGAAPERVHQRELSAKLGEALVALRRVDDEVLRLAVGNSNLKASTLLFGPVAEASAELEAALGRAVASRAGAPDAERAGRLALVVEAGVLRVETLLAPHIAEASDARMDALEAAMARARAPVHPALDGLAALPGLSGGPAIQAARASLARHEALEARVLALSRENTNVRSLALSLNEKRRALAASLEALAALRQALQDEPIPGVPIGRQPTR